MGVILDSSSASEDDELYVVEQILARKKKGNKVYYLLKWEGYDETTWEPAENILDKEMLENFDRSFMASSEVSKEVSKTHYCDICANKKGRVYRCKSCSIHRHLECIDPSLFSESDSSVYICDICKKDEHICCICRSSTEDDSSKLRCRLCHRGFHDSCGEDFDRNDSTCFECGKYPTTIEEILSMRQPNEDNGSHEVEFLVKFKTWSYRKVFWVPESWLNIFTPQRVQRFKKNRIELDERQVIQEDWCHVDKIMYEDVDAKSGGQFLVKWRGLGPEHSTWEDEGSAGGINLFGDVEIPHEEFTSALKKYRRSLKINKAWSPRKGKLEHFKKLEQKDVSVTCTLMPYQLDGINWLLYNWHKGRNCLLADEMGLGKTVQTITLMEHVRLNYGNFPVLVVAPSTVCENWINELNRWAPNVYHVLYGGLQEARSLIAEYELFNDQMEMPSSLRRMKLIKNHVVVVSFQTLTRDASVLKSVPWQMIVVDEAHRLKGQGNLLSKQLEGFHDCFRLLLTGTPLQNNIGELFNILSFLDPESFGDTEALSLRYENLTEEKEKVKELHELLRPRILRRTKKDVGLDESIPPKRELLVPVSMTGPQMAIYKSILQKNFKILAKIGQKGSKVSLSNIWMELRKCVNHAYLIIDEPAHVEKEAVIQQLLSMSGKLELLDKMLERMRAEKRKVLIFSQMTRMLDIIQDYLALKGYPLRRLDGQTPVDERQTLISAFNNGESDEFCFLLSTRAGGLGVNLTSADTVILFDHDYNPHNDLQALCRAHRIGQKNVLFIYRLVTVNSIEESIVAVARSKLVLDHVVVEQMNKIDQGEIAKILKLGVEKLFGEEKPQRIVYDEDSLKQLMDRSALPVEKESESPEEMSIFKEEVFSNARIWETEERQPGTEGDADFWAKFIPAQEGTPTKVELGKGKRKRHHIGGEKEMGRNDPVWSSEDVESSEQEEDLGGYTITEGELPQLIAPDQPAVPYNDQSAAKKKIRLLPPKTSITTSVRSDDAPLISPRMANILRRRNSVQTTGVGTMNPPASGSGAVRPVVPSRSAINTNTVPLVHEGQNIFFNNLDVKYILGHCILMQLPVEQLHHLVKGSLFIPPRFQRALLNDLPFYHIEMRIKPQGSLTALKHVFVPIMKGKEAVYPGLLGLFLLPDHMILFAIYVPMKHIMVLVPAPIPVNTQPEMQRPAGASNPVLSTGPSNTLLSTGTANLVSTSKPGPSTSNRFASTVVGTMSKSTSTPSSSTVSMSQSSSSSGTLSISTSTSSGSMDISVPTSSIATMSKSTSASLIKEVTPPAKPVQTRPPSSAPPLVAASLPESAVQVTKPSSQVTGVQPSGQVTGVQTGPPADPRKVFAAQKTAALQIPKPEILTEVKNQISSQPQAPFGVESSKKNAQVEAKSKVNSQPQMPIGVELPTSKALVEATKQGEAPKPINVELPKPNAQEKKVDAPKVTDLEALKLKAEMPSVQLKEKVAVERTRTPLVSPSIDLTKSPKPKADAKISKEKIVELYRKATETNVGSPRNVSSNFTVQVTPVMKPTELGLTNRFMSHSNQPPAANVASSTSSSVIQSTPPSPSHSRTSFEARYLVQSSKLQRLEEENLRLRRENEMFREIMANQAPKSESSSGICSGLISPQKSSPTLSSLECFRCRWRDCADRQFSSRAALKEHVRSVHLNAP